MNTIHHDIRRFISKGDTTVLAEIADDDSLLEMGILDSLGVLELVGFLEQHYGVHVSDDELMPEHFDSIKAIAAFVAERRTVAH